MPLYFRFVEFLVRPFLQTPVLEFFDFVRCLLFCATSSKCLPLEGFLRIFCFYSHVICVFDFPESLLSMAIVVGICPLQRVEGLSVLSLCMEVCYPVSQNLPKDGVVPLSTPSHT